MLDWLAPARRRAIYAALAAVGAVLAAVGVATDAQVVTWLGVAQEALGVAALVMASVKARRIDYTAAYGGFAALGAALAAAGLLEDGQVETVLGVVSKVLMALPLIVAAVRTDPSTPTGEPAGEYPAAA